MAYSKVHANNQSNLVSGETANLGWHVAVVSGKAPTIQRCIAVACSEDKEGIIFRRDCNYVNTAQYSTFAKQTRSISHASLGNGRITEIASKLRFEMRVPCPCCRTTSIINLMSDLDPQMQNALDVPPPKLLRVASYVPSLSRLRTT